MFLVFNIYGLGGQFVQSCGTILTNQQFSFERRPHVNLVKIGQTVSEKKTFIDYTILYIRIAQKQGQTTPNEQRFNLTEFFYYYFNHTL